MLKQNFVSIYFMYAACVLVLSVCFISCDDEQLVDMKVDNTTLTTRAVPTPVMDWENLDWMPTPPSQERIPSPWSGQGSLASTYGLDIVNDRKASDGWTLLYNTFDATAPGKLVNPYFILYNVYRGTMRIYFYVTTSFISPSSYIQDGIAVNGNTSTSILNFLGNDRVDLTKKNISRYMQMQPVPLDGSSSLASKRWYLLQYELAYDPNIPNIPYNQIQLSWTMNFYNLSKINLGGGVVGKLNGIIGQGSDPDFFSALGNVGKVVGTGVLAGIGRDFVTHNTVNSETGENKLGISKSIFKDLSKGISAALSGATGDLPSAAIKLASAILGGGSTSTPISFDLRADINLEGTSSTQGSFPSTPVSLWMPGTNITSSATNYIPAYNKVLGVVNFKGTRKPYLSGEVERREFSGVDPYNGYQYTTIDCCKRFPNVDCSSYLVINPEVQKIADVRIVKQEVVEFQGDYMIINPTLYWTEGYSEVGSPIPLGEPEADLGVRFFIEVKPKNGGPAVTIVKTLACVNM